MEDFALKAVQADLAARITALDRTAGWTSAGDLASSLEAIRRIAQANGIYPAVTVIHAIDSALARGERGPLVRGWLAILQDAVGCERADARTDSTFAAICAVRYG